MMINIPILGGTGRHAIGVAVLSILFNPWVAFVCISLVLLIQALIFGYGGITTWAITSLGLGFISSFSSYYIYKLLKKLNKNFALFVSGWTSIVLVSIFIAIVLGIQPVIAHDEKGNPLFFPFDLKITVPTIVGAHILYFGVIEGIYTLLIVKFVKDFLLGKEETVNSGSEIIYQDLKLEYKVGEYYVVNVCALYILSKKEILLTSSAEKLINKTKKLKYRPIVIVGADKNQIMVIALSTYKRRRKPTIKFDQKKITVNLFHKTVFYQNKKMTLMYLYLHLKK